MADATAADGGQVRTCPKCGETKPTSAFSRSSRTKHGFQSRCKKCKKAEARAAYARDPEPHRRRGREQAKRRKGDPALWVEVSCCDCGKTWLKWKPSIPGWQGRCGSCAAKLSALTPGMSEAKADRARRQVEAWGGRIPNAKPWGVERPIRGAAHPRWKGGVTDANRRERSTRQYVDWRNAVYRRDGWTCQRCGQVGGKLHAHHVKRWADYPELRFEVDNGVTLCVGCHRAVHAEEAGRWLTEGRIRKRDAEAMLR